MIGEFIHPAPEYPTSHSGGACPGMLLSGSRNPERTGCRITSGMTKFLWIFAALFRRSYGCQMADGRVYDVNGRNPKNAETGPTGNRRLCLSLFWAKGKDARRTSEVWIARPLAGGYFTFTSSAFGLAFSVFGRATFRTPSLKEASIFDSSILSGRIKLRMKLP